MISIAKEEFGAIDFEQGRAGSDHSPNCFRLIGQKEGFWGVRLEDLQELITADVDFSISASVLLCCICGKYPCL